MYDQITFQLLRLARAQVYALQIVDALLLPADNALLRRAVEWRRVFLATGGLDQVPAHARARPFPAPHDPLLQISPPPLLCWR
jgi:hypothetical protein